jgi:YfiH family protein
MIEILTADNLATLANIRHAFFTRGYGNPGLSRAETRNEALQVRALMAAQLGVAPENFLCCHQIHSPDVVTVTEIWQPLNNPQADALVTDKKGVALGVMTADCVPVLFADKGAGVIGAAHAGWRGALSGVLENTLDAMEKQGALRRRIETALGPCIWQNSYEVGPEFPAPFLAEDPAQARFFRPAFKSDHYMFDLPGYVMARLRQQGVGSVEPSMGDTCAAPELFFSHRHTTLRGEKRDGNLMSAIAMIE